MINRLKKLAIADYAVNKKFYLLTLLIVIALFAFLFVNSIEFTKRNLEVRDFDSEYVNSQMIKNIAHMSSMIIFYIAVAFIVLSARAFQNYQNKKLNVFLTLFPLSQKEKFLYIMVRNIILVPLLLVILRANVILWCHVYSIEPIPTVNLGINEILVFFTCCSIYTFSSISFRKSQIAIATIIILGLSYVMPIIVNSTGISIWESSLTTVATSVIIVVMLCWTWINYKNLQIK